MKRIGKNATPVLLAIAASVGLVSAQTPFMIASVSSGQVLDVPDFSTTAGKLIQQWPANSGANQHWTLRRVLGTGYYEIISVIIG